MVQNVATSLLSQLKTFSNFVMDFESNDLMERMRRIDLR
jgi:hypothetical protein